MADLLLAPYLVLKNPVSVGPWDLVPFRQLQEDDADEDEERREWLLEASRLPVLRLVEAYRVKHGMARLGAVVVPKDGKAGDPFERREMTALGHALLVGTVADNPQMALPEDEQPANGGRQIATSENALLYGHPLVGGNSYAISTGILIQTTEWRTAADHEELPEVTPPLELPTPSFGNFDDEIADAAHALLTAGDVDARRLGRSLDWYRIVLSNAEAVPLDVRVGAARSAIEALTGLSAETKKVVREYGRMMREASTTERTYDDVFWAKGSAQLTSDEWWLTRLSQLRNGLVHGDVMGDDLWNHEGHHQLNHIHDRLIALLKRVVADRAADPLLRLTLGERVFPRIAEKSIAWLRAQQASGEVDDG